MYNVMIVDDDKGIRNGLTLIIDWNSYGFKIAGTYANGVEAIEALKKDRFDLVLTDIRMPGMDGLELITEMKQNMHPAQVVILSGYSEFEYARRAIELGVNDYLLKPVKEDKLISIVKKIYKNIKLGEKQSLSIQRQMVKNIIYDEIKEIEQFRIIGEKADKYQICIIEIHKTDEDTQGRGLLALPSLIEAVQEKVKERGLVFQVNDERIGILFYCNTKRAMSDTVEYLNIIEDIKEKHHLDAHILVGSVTDSLERLSESYKNALLLSEYKYLNINKSMLVQEDLKRISNGNTNIDWEAHNLLAYMEISDYENVGREIDLLVSEIEKKRIPFKLTRNIFINVIVEINILAKKISNGKNEIPIDENRENIGLAYSHEAISKDETIKSMGRFLKNLCIGFSKTINACQVGTSSECIKEIVQYLEANYYRNLNLQDIAQKFYFNPAYLGRAFKKETGKSFIEYYNLLRIEKASAMLKNTDMSIGEICSRVGYPNINYFGKIYKKYMGKSPSAFRKS